MVALKVCSQYCGIWQESVQDEGRLNFLFTVINWQFYIAAIRNPVTHYVGATVRWLFFISRREEVSNLGSLGVWAFHDISLFLFGNLLVFEISSSTTCTGMMWFVKCLGNLIDSTQHLLCECRTLNVVEFSFCFMLYETAGKRWCQFHIISSYCRSRLPIQIISSLHAWIIIVIFS